MPGCPMPRPEDHNETLVKAPRKHVCSIMYQPAPPDPVHALSVLTAVSPHHLLFCSASTG
ncbi:hypothetical protein BU25DRAFT_413843 [Macroventuria anomochaeta]|uniref:Uncharacterized protein n=1 Tax=Macroventuria anomochaeta TaxID=301207 RepID=A0ACB6RRC1_9PLEO|nr:uncharacterized protein BU25DRAFT_413843 [Macroventuria anomochaeta]KAF2623950.1 hypothetical protein BU25DRAFT_413843 [Macroventuria anomochaeta]